jgi:HSP20 family molecular chaperone IbpA
MSFYQADPFFGITGFPGGFGGFGGLGGFGTRGFGTPFGGTLGGGGLGIPDFFTTDLTDFFPPLAAGVQDISIPQTGQPFSADLALRRNTALEGKTSNPLTLWVDVFEQPDGYILAVDAPGVEKKDITIELQDNNVLVITVNRKIRERGTEQGKRLRQERDHGVMKRTLRLPRSLDSSKMQARLENGILQIFVPRSDQARQNLQQGEQVPQIQMQQQQQQQPLQQQQQPLQQQQQPLQQPSQSQSPKFGAQKMDVDQQGVQGQQDVQGQGQQQGLLGQQQQGQASQQTSRPSVQEISVGGQGKGEVQQPEQQQSQSSQQSQQSSQQQRQSPVGGQQQQQRRRIPVE